MALGQTPGSAGVGLLESARKFGVQRAVCLGSAGQGLLLDHAHA